VISWFQDCLLPNATRTATPWEALAAGAGDADASADEDPRVGLALFTTLLYCASKHGSIDDSQYGPCNQSNDTRE
jgi:hypothetical protein